MAGARRCAGGGRGRVTARQSEREWCERRLVARIHRYPLDRLRQEIEPVTARDFMRFLFRWQRIAEDTRGEGPEGLAAVLELLDGFEAPAGAWEGDVLPARLADYDPLWLDGLCLSGEVAWGLVTSDSFAGLRALLVPSDRRRPIGAGGFRRRGRVAPFGVETAGRWSRVRRGSPLGAEQVAEAVAWQLLRRYGVVFRRLVARETLLPPWRDILRVYRRLEARGEVRGGRFVGGFSGEQYALPEAVGSLRAVRRVEPRGELTAVGRGGPPEPP